MEKTFLYVRWSILIFVSIYFTNFMRSKVSAALKDCRLIGVVEMLTELQRQMVVLYPTQRLLKIYYRIDSFKYA